jgi:transposase-like protein
MVLAPSVAGLFKWRQFEPEVILLAVGWYLRFSLSYRDVEELLAERGLHADHVTVWRWVQRYAPEMERRLRSRLKQTNDSWRVDETYIRVKGKWVYLYLQRRDDRLLALGQTRHRSRQALSGQSLGR